MTSNLAYAANTYKNNQVMNASGKKLLIMLYEGAIKNLKLSEMSIKVNEIEKTNTHIIKAQNIITELMYTLNFEAGGEISQNLYQLYEYMYKRLIHGNIKKDLEAIVEVRNYLEELKETWLQI